MHTLESTQLRLSNFRAAIAGLKESEFPYDAPRQALDILDQKFIQHEEMLKHLDSTSSDRGTVMRRCADASADIILYLPLLGFFLRSTNVRNAFEIYGPLRRIARQLIGVNTQLVLSSEWDYSPFTYTRIGYLPDFVLIGFPATESDNPHILPLAGHELGHTLWIIRELERDILPSLKITIVNEIQSSWAKYKEFFPGTQTTQLSTDLVAMAIWSDALNWSLRQAEEVFRDFVGLKIFGTAYLEAFSFLIAPRLSQIRLEVYPSIQDRVAYMCQAAQTFKVVVPAGYAERFEGDPVPKLPRAAKFNLDLADIGCRKVAPHLLEKADSEVTSKGFPKPIPAKRRRGGAATVRSATLKEQVARLRNAVPIENAGSLSDIVNSGWAMLDDPGFWAKLDHIPDPTNALKDLIIKSIEIFEIEQIKKNMVPSNAHIKR